VPLTIQSCQFKHFLMMMVLQVLSAHKIMVMVDKVWIPPQIFRKILFCLLYAVMITQRHVSHIFQIASQTAINSLLTITLHANLNLKKKSANLCMRKEMMSELKK
jgi:hypothetical protein